MIMFDLSVSKHGWDEDVILEAVPWADARTWMVDLLTIWLGDNCRRCVEHAAEQLPALQALAPDTIWSGDMEGEEFFIRQAGAS